MLFMRKVVCFGVRRFKFPLQKSTYHCPIELCDAGMSTLSYPDSRVCSCRSERLRRVCVISAGQLPSFLCSRKDLGRFPLAGIHRITAGALFWGLFHGAAGRSNTDRCRLAAPESGGLSAGFGYCLHPRLSNVVHLRSTASKRQLRTANLEFRMLTAKVITDS